MVQHVDSTFDGVTQYCISSNTHGSAPRPSDLCAENPAMREDDHSQRKGVTHICNSSSQVKKSYKNIRISQCFKGSTYLRVKLFLWIDSSSDE